MAAQHRIGMPEKWDRLDTHTVTADDLMQEPNQAKLVNPIAAKNF